MGKSPRGCQGSLFLTALPRQSAPHGSAAAPPQRQRGSSLNYPPCPGKAAGAGQMWMHLFRVGREHPSSQPHQAGSVPSHRYFHGLTSALLPAGGLFSKTTVAAAVSLQRAGPCPIHPPAALGGRGEGLTKPSPAIKIPNLHSHPVTGILGGEGCCQIDRRCASKQLQAQRNE